MIGTRALAGVYVVVAKPAETVSAFGLHNGLAGSWHICYSELARVCGVIACPATRPSLHIIGVRFSNEQ